MSAIPTNLKLNKHRRLPGDLFDSSNIYANIKRTNKSTVFHQDDLLVRVKYFHTTQLTITDTGEIDNLIKTNVVNIYVNSDFTPSHESEDQQALSLYLNIDKEVPLQNEGKFTIILHDENRGIQKPFIIQLPNGSIEPDHPHSQEVELPPNRNLHFDEYGNLRPDDDLFNAREFTGGVFEEYTYQTIIKYQGRAYVKVKFFHMHKGFKLHDSRPVSDVNSSAPKINMKFNCDKLDTRTERRHQRVVSFEFNAKGHSSEKVLKFKFDPEPKTCPEFDSKEKIYLTAITHECDIIIPKL